MSPAHTDDHDIDLDKLVRQIVLDVSILRWEAVNAGRTVAVAMAIAVARRQATPIEARILDFLEQHAETRDWPRDSH